MTSAALSLRGGLDTIIVAKSNVNDASLIGGHGAQLNTVTLAGSAIGARTGDGLKLLALTTLIALNIDDYRITEANGAHGNGGHQELQRIKGLTMTTNEHRQIIAGDVQNELALVTLVLVNGNLADVELLQDVLKCSDGRISDVVEHLIGDLRLLAFLDNLGNYVLFFHGVSFHIKQKECFT